MSFLISPAPLDPAALARALADERAGACVTFEGWVRNRNEGQPVLSLEYEAYAALADKEGAKLTIELSEDDFYTIIEDLQPFRK